MEGPLSKWTNVMKGWQYRWFVLDEMAGLFSYYTSRDKMVRGVRRGCVRLRGAVIGIDDEDEATFTITVDGKTFHFQAKDSEERERWIRALEDTVLRHNQTRRSSARRLISTSESGQPVVSIEEFEKKLTETDSYLEILLSQVAELKARSESSNDVEDTKEKLHGVIQRAQDLTESIKHAIVLLQIAKNAALPSEVTTGAMKDFSNLPLVHKPVSSANAPTSSARNSLSSAPSSVKSVFGPTISVEEGSEVSEEAERTIIIASTSNVIPVLKASDKRNPIPDCSYSSSDDEDDFFDAEDDYDEDEKKDENDHARLGRENPLRLSLEPMEEPDPVPLQSPLTPSTGEPVDYDALYDQNDEQDDVDMKSHGSVITHLLSQVRIGMDLTKIVLPTFILERRSLLEMYSDFFAHPDIFVGITEGRTAEDRIVRVLRWYLSSFHAGRKSSIAKKPYNPILGETFRCHWNLKDSEKVQKSMTDGPLPWCSQDDLTFVAEQVSHHPPVSAFYAEHPSKRISVNAHIYTKSSFLGMSVAVHNIGQGKLTLLDHNEDYICTFPSGYGRSILTVPWIELGGKVALTCPQTNYYANIEFKCKQFFSSDVNKISAEVFAPNTKRPFLRVDGEWNGRMMAKWASGKNEVFIDVTKTPVHQKICKPIAEQGRFESRRLWKDVTLGLKIGDIESATKAKTALEQRQRQEAAERKEKKESWQTKLFQPIGENWEFMEPLGKRLANKK